MPRNRVRLSLIAASVCAVGLLAACTSGTTTTAASSAAVTSSAARTSTSAAPSTSKAPTTPAKPKPTKPVHVSLFESDGSTWGVGIPIIAWFDVAPTDAHAFANATKVTVNGQPEQGNWYFEDTQHQLPNGQQAALEAHWRPQHYWPAHSKIHLDLPVDGLSAGPGLSYNDSLTLDISTGAANLSTIDASTETMTVTSDGQNVGTYPVSLGAPDTPTKRGIKVIMEKGASICMSGPGYDECGIKYTQRLTYDGEYLHSAPWNCSGSPGCSGVNHIGYANTSNGCTNLRPTDAAKLYAFFIQGDVFDYPNADGPQMQLGDGFGDWNVSWSQWQTGGELKV